MRNLKRALSLTLASVMLLGMMVIGTSAVAGYSDVDVNDNVEAIEVLQAVEVMVGDDRGFGPDRPVTRAEMAVVMGKLLNLDYNYYVSTCPFADVSGNYEWARGWVGACAANGIVSGRGDGIYDPGATVTAIEAASMMMRALGYFKYAEDYNDGFVLVTVRQGNQIGIFNGVGSDGSTPMTRNQVAQMALNALRSEMVDFTGTLGVELNGVKVNYRAEYTSRTSTEKKYNAIEGRTSDVASDANHKGQYYVQLGEELYDGKLRLNNSATDSFGRPSRHWEYDGKAIGTYMKKELLDKEWTTEVKGKDLYDLLGSDTIKNYSFDITIDGVSIDEKTGTTDNNTVLKTGANSGAPYFDETFMAKTYKSGVGGTGKGVLTQVFVNADTKEVDVAVINTYLAKATADYNTKKDEAKFDVYALTHVNSGNDAVYYKYADACKNTAKNAETLAISSDDFDIAEDVKKDDIVLVTVANGEIMSIAQPEVISAATLNGFSKDSYVVAEGTKYEYNTTVDYDPDTLDDYTGTTQQLKNTQYDVYLDQYGYLIGVKVVDAVNNYIFVTGIDQGASNRKNKTAEASGILLDGTFIEFTMDTKNSVSYWAHGEMNQNDKTGAGKGGFGGGSLWNTWCTYTVDKDGVYTLKEVKATIDTDNGVKVAQTHDTDYMDKTIDHKHVSLLGGTGYSRVYGNDDTVYIVPELSAVATDTELEKDSVWVPKHSNNSNAKDITAPTANKRGVKSNVGIISGVSSVTVGIDNVDLRTWTLAEIKSQDDGKLGNVDNVIPGNVYTLYNKDGYVIAAVVLGEDNGTTKNLVYSHKGSIESERYEKADDEWTWTRKVIKNGVETLLTQKGDDADRANGIYGMSENTWYEVNFKADGSVKSVKHAYYTESGKNAGTTPASNPALTLNNGSNGKDFVDDIHNMENATENNSTVLYEEVWGDNETVSKAPSLKGSTLYVDTANKEGFYVNKNDIKSVLIQKNNSESSTTYYDTIGELEDILDDLNVDENGNYNFKISGILTEGRATVVIIHDWNETEGEKGEKPVTPTGGDDGKVVLHKGKLFVDISLDDIDDQAAAIQAFLEKNEYTEVEVRIEGTDIFAQARSAKGVIYKWDTDGSGNNNIDLTDSVITIKVGGTEKKVPDSATVAEVTGTTSNAKNFVMETSTSTTKAVSTDSTVTAGENYGTDAYVEYQATDAGLTTTAPSAKWTVSDLSATVVTAKKSGADTKFVKVGSTVTYKLTSAGAVTQAKDAAAPTTQYSLALAGAAFDVSKCTYKDWKYTAAGGKLETQLVAGDTQNDVTYIGASDTITVSITVPTSAELTNTTLKLTETALA